MKANGIELSSYEFEDGKLTLRFKGEVVDEVAKIDTTLIKITDGDDDKLMASFIGYNTSFIVYNMISNTTSASYYRQPDTTDYTSLAEKVSEQNTAIEGMKGDIQTQNQSIESQNTKISAQDEKIGTQETKLTEQDEKISEQDLKIQAHEEKMTELTETVTTVDGKFGTIQETVDQQSLAIGAMQVSVDAQNEIVNEAKETVEGQNETIAQTKQDLDTKTAEQDEKIGTFETRLDEQDEKIETLDIPTDAIQVFAMVAAPSMTDEQAMVLADYWPEWSDKSVEYEAKTVVKYKGELYRCAQKHTSSEVNNPTVASLWTKIEIASDGYDVWKQPSGSHDAYDKGVKVHYPDADGPIYESQIPGNTTVPGSDERWWKLVEE